MTDNDPAPIWWPATGRQLGDDWVRMRLLSSGDDPEADPTDEHVLGWSIAVAIGLALLVGLIWPDRRGAAAALSFLVLAVLSVRVYDAGVYVSRNGVRVRAFPFRLQARWADTRFDGTSPTCTSCGPVSSSQPAPVTGASFVST